MNEIWRPIEGYVGFYEVSNCGRVRSVDRILLQTRRGTRCQVSFKGRIIRPASMPSGHLSVVLSRNGSVEGFKVHSLVAEAFIRRKRSGEHVNHLDFDPRNNNLENLEITTPSGNVNHSMLAGRLGTKLHRDKVLQIRYELAWGEKQATLARKLDVSIPNMSAIAKGRNWRWANLSDLAQHD